MSRRGIRKCRFCGGEGAAKKRAVFVALNADGDLVFADFATGDPVCNYGCASIALSRWFDHGNLRKSQHPKIRFRELPGRKGVLGV